MPKNRCGWFWVCPRLTGGAYNNSALHSAPYSLQRQTSQKSHSGAGPYVIGAPPLPQVPSVSRVREQPSLPCWLPVATMVWWSWLLTQLAVWSCAGVAAVLWWLWVTRPRVDVPGPPTLPIIGNILEFREVPVTLHKFRELHHRYGDLTRFYLGPILVVLVAHPDDVQHTLLTCKMVDRDPFTTHAMRVFAGDGILATSGDRWKTHRKHVSHTFHSELLEGYLQAFHEGGLLLSERLARTRGAVTLLYPPVLLAAVRNVLSTVIGIDPDLLIPDTLAEEELSAAMSDAMATIQMMILRPWLQNKFLLKMTSKGRGLFKYTQLLQDWAMKCIAMTSTTTDKEPATKHLNLTESLVRTGGQTTMPLNEARDAIMNVIVAGSEATSVSISFVLAVLSLQPKWQDAVHQELRAVFGEGDDYLRPATLADLADLRVLESVIKETLRLFPAVPLIPRVASEDLWLSKGQVLVPKGTLLFVSSFLTHRLPEFFPDPLRFDPSRFLEGCGGKEHACSYLPFGMGPRNCVGYQYARLELKAMLAGVLRRFRFLPHTTWEDLEGGTISVTQHPVKPIRVSCVPLEGPVTCE
ncbi:cytochrome P450 4C1-like [Schistocerca serialis cubense]|uniref:cytochrome P450 4C1-like n=1 Tax=Schistocerca serialis cubense TaxID=2023355 RepID=UPI00214E4A51|nr:cytochrome P450 4C1-like [Schistocerca serialis cubense]